MKTKGGEGSKENKHLNTRLDTKCKQSVEAEIYQFWINGQTKNTQKKHRRETDQPTDRRTDRRTDGPTNRRSRPTDEEASIVELHACSFVFHYVALNKFR